MGLDFIHTMLYYNDSVVNINVLRIELNLKNFSIENPNQKKFNQTINVHFL